ncbi:MAG: hypothetical protein ACRDQA_05855 [Nocardioidaceae bacterium]
MNNQFSAAEMHPASGTGPTAGHPSLFRPLNQSLAAFTSDTLQANMARAITASSSLQEDRMRLTWWLSIVARVVAALSVLAAVISVIARWPHQFGGHGDRRHMMADFLNSGTAMAPPLVILVVFLLAALLVARRDGWGTAACVGVLLVSVLMIVGAVGEATAPPTPDVPRAVQLFSGIWGAVAGALLIALAGASLRERRGTRVQRSTRSV